MKGEIVLTDEEKRRIEIIMRNLGPGSIIHKDTFKVFLDPSFIDEFEK